MNEAPVLPAQGAVAQPAKAGGARREVELKLLVAPPDLRRFLRHPEVQAAKRGRARRAQFHATYYDTPDHALARNALALRVRREGALWVQAIKGRGASGAGLHARDEYEWPLAAPRVNLDALARSPFAKFFAREEVGSRLQPVFTTEFVRTTLALELGQGVQAELAVDEGAIRAGRRSAPISEIEIEMKAGEAAAAFRLALAVQESVPLTLGARSKAERGYALARNAIDTPQKAKSVALDDTLDAGDALRAIAWSCIAQMQANEAGAIDGRDPEFLHQFRVGLRRLRSCVALARAPIAASNHPDLLEELRWLQNALGPARDWDVFATATLPPILVRFGANADVTKDASTHAGEATEAAPGEAAVATEAATATGAPTKASTPSPTSPSPLPLSRSPSPPSAKSFSPAPTVLMSSASTSPSSMRAEGGRRDDILSGSDDSAGLAGLRARAAQLRRTHGRAAAEVLRSPRYSSLLLTLGLVLCDDALYPKGEETAWLAMPVEKYAVAVLERRYKKLKKRGAELSTATPAERHRARIAAKKLRYAAEFLSPLFGRKKTRRYVAALSGLQDALGAQNDAAVTERLLAEVVAVGKTPPKATAIALVRGWVAGAAHHGLGELADRWETFIDCGPFWD